MAKKAKTPAKARPAPAKARKVPARARKAPARARKAPASPKPKRKPVQTRPAAEVHASDQHEHQARAEYLGPARRRPLVLDAALDLFAEGGFGDAAMEALARRAGTTKPVLYDCFPGGKQEIYFALLDREEERFRAHMLGLLASTKRMKLRDALHAGVAAFLDYADLNPNGFRVLFGPQGSVDPGIVERGVRVREQVIATMTERSVAIGDPVNAPPLVVELYNRGIIAMAEEIARWWLLRKPLSRDAMVEITVNWMMLGFEGLLPREVIDTPRFGPSN